MKEIVLEGKKVLRQTAKDFPISEIGSSKFNKIIAEMSASLDSQDNGAAIAAPQIGESWRIFVVSGKILPLKGGKEQPNQIFINPIIKKTSSQKNTLEEGCLSVPNIFGKIKRADKILIEAYNEKGHKFAKQGSNLLAQVFQHEIDHLNGILFIDKATDLIKINE